MEILKVIRDEDFGLTTESEITQKREASRAVVFDAEGKVALLHVTKKNYHKLPGGGIDEGESIEAALERELLEEIGCKVGSVKELGVVEEFRGKFDLHQTSCCFVSDVLGEKGTAHLEQGEIDDGFEQIWMPLEEAIKTLESERTVEDYEGKFIVLRDVTFLKEAHRLFSHHD